MNEDLHMERAAGNIPSPIEATEPLVEREVTDAMVEALQKIANPPTKNGFQEMALWMQRVAKAALR